jgi:hypothetical protein
MAGIVCNCDNGDTGILKPAGGALFLKAIHCAVILNFAISWQFTRDELVIVI